MSDPDLIPIPQEHVDKMIAQGEKMLPVIANIPTRGVMAVARPSLAKGEWTSAKSAGRLNASTTKAMALTAW